MPPRDSTTGEAAAGEKLAAARSAAFVEHARRYVELGWALVRLDGKRPKDDRWQTTAPDRDSEHVAGLWNVWGKRWDMGVALGPSGLAVVEYDSDEAAGTLVELLGGELPLTPTAQTGSGRLHIYFRDPGVAKSARDGLELRTGAHQCVLPPSLHPRTGHPYRWLAKLEPWSVELGELPAAVLEHMAEPRRDGRAAPVDEAVPEGQRRQVLLSLAGTMRRRGMSGEEIEAALAAVNERRCRPPLPVGELAELARDVASRYTPQSSLISIPAPNGNGFAGKNPPDGGELPFGLLASLVDDAPAEPPWRWRGYAAVSAVTLFAGRPKVGKSTLVLALLAAAAQGEPFLGLETSCAGVLLLSEERRDTLAEKARILGLDSFRQPVSPIGAGNEFSPVHALMRHDAGGTPWPEIVRQAIAYCTRQRLDVLVVDTFDRWTGLRGDAENSAGAINEALEPLQFAAAAGLAVLIVSHQRKSSGEFGDAVRGSNALTGGVDVIAELERPSRTLQLEGHARVLRAVSRFSSTPEELYLELGEHGFDRIDDPEQRRTDTERAHILAELERRTEPIASDPLADELELEKRAVRRLLNELLEKNLAVRTGAGKKNDPYQWTAAADESA